MRCKCRVEQILSSSEMCGKFGLDQDQGNLLSWYRLQIIIKLLNMLLLLQGKSQDKFIKVRQTLTELRTALLYLLKCVEVCKPELLAEPQTEQPCLSQL